MSEKQRRHYSSQSAFRHPSESISLSSFSPVSVLLSLWCTPVSLLPSSVFFMNSPLSCESWSLFYAREINFNISAGIIYTISLDLWHRDEMEQGHDEGLVSRIAGLQGEKEGTVSSSEGGEDRWISGGKKRVSLWTLWADLHNPTVRKCKFTPKLAPTDVRSAKSLHMYKTCSIVEK